MEGERRGREGKGGEGRGRECLNRAAGCLTPVM